MKKILFMMLAAGGVFSGMALAQEVEPTQVTPVRQMTPAPAPPGAHIKKTGTPNPGDFKNTPTRKKHSGKKVAGKLTPTATRKVLGSDEATPEDMVPTSGVGPDGDKPISPYR